MLKQWRFLVVLGAGLLSCSLIDDSPQHPPAVFAVNLSSLAMDLSLGDPTASHLLITDLPAGQARPLVSLTASPAVQLYFKNHKDANWNLWKNEEGKAFEVDFKVGKSYALIVRSSGQAAIQILGEQYNNKPKLAIINDTGFKINQVQIGQDLGRDLRIYTQDLEASKLTLFFSPDAGTVRVFWKMEGVPEFPDFVELADEKGQIQQTELKDDSAYLLWLHFDRLAHQTKTTLLNISRPK